MPNILQGVDMPTESKYEVQKVNNTRHLSRLAMWILLNAGQGIERANIVAKYFNIERLYCGFYVDPCFRPKERRRHNGIYRHSQPRVTMTLKRLEQRGLVRLIRHGKYVKEVCLTEKGKLTTQKLSQIDSGNKRD